MSLYVYGVLDAEGALLLQVTGVQEQTPRLLKIDELYVIVSEFAGASLIPSKLNVHSHERVLESVMDRTTPLPFRFGTVLSEDRLHEFIRSNHSLLRRDLEEVRGCVEMGLKVLIAEPLPDIPLPPTTGTEFLQSRQRRQAARREAAAWVDSAVSGIVRRSNVSAMEGTVRIVVRIAHLVPRSLLGDYRSRVDSLVHQRTEHGFLTSGPWPPYSFISTSYAG